MCFFRRAGKGEKRERETGEGRARGKGSGSASVTPVQDSQSMYIISTPKELDSDVKGRPRFRPLRLRFGQGTRVAEMGKGTRPDFTRFFPFRRASRRKKVRKTCLNCGKRLESPQAQAGRPISFFQNQIREYYRKINCVMGLFEFRRGEAVWFARLVARFKCSMLVEFLKTDPQTLNLDPYQLQGGERWKSM
ncbi:hypothetical protein ES706_00019 [subsurface metagenome]